MSKSLFQRAFLLYLAASAITIASISTVSTIQLARTSRDQTVHNLEFAVQIMIALAGSESEEAMEAVTAVAAGFVDRAGLYHSNGTTQDSSSGFWDSLMDQYPTLDRAVAGAIEGGPITTGTARSERRRPTIEFAVARVDDSTVAVATQPSSASASQSTSLVGVLVTTTLILVVAGGILLTRLLRWINGPVQALREVARTVAKGGIDAAQRIDGPRELVLLAGDLDEMAVHFRGRIAEISRQRNQFEAILTSMLEGVIVLDTDRRILAINKASGRLLGVDPAAAGGRTLIEFLRNAQLDELAEMALTGGQAIERTITLYGERPLHLQVHSTPLTSDGSQLLGSLMVINDITRLVQLETLRRDFVANVSHELKTPITSIQGFVETLLDGPPTDPAESRRYLEIINNHTQRLNAIIEDLLSLSRLEHTDQSITFRPFSISELVAAVQSTCVAKADKRGIELRWNCTGADRAWGNPNLLEQALVNLVDNAIKYSAENSTVMAELTNENGSLTARVSDRGLGISTKDLPRVFERFYRTDKARSRDLGGTGLGLAIVKHIARAHRGTVGASSIYGEGSTFTIEIPQHALEHDPATSEH